MKASELTNSQKAQIGYTKLENAMNISFAAVIFATVASVFSMFLDPIIAIIWPATKKDSPPLSVRFAIMMLFLWVAIGVVGAFIFCCCTLMMQTKINVANKRRLRPIIIGGYCITILVILIIFSTFVDYSSLRGWVILWSGVAMITTLIVSYSLYYRQLRRDINAVATLQ